METGITGITGVTGIAKEKGRPGVPERPFAWSAAGSAAYEAFIAEFMQSAIMLRVAESRPLC